MVYPLKFPLIALSRSVPVTSCILSCSHNVVIFHPVCCLQLAHIKAPQAWLAVALNSFSVASSKHIPQVVKALTHLWTNMHTQCMSACIFLTVCILYIIRRLKLQVKSCEETRRFRVLRNKIFLAS